MESVLGFDLHLSDWFNIGGSKRRIIFKFQISFSFSLFYSTPNLPSPTFFNILGEYGRGKLLSLLFLSQLPLFLSIHLSHSNTQSNHAEVVILLFCIFAGNQCFYRER